VTRGIHFQHNEHVSLTW